MEFRVSTKFPIRQFGLLFLKTSLCLGRCLTDRPQTLEDKRCYSLIDRFIADAARRYTCSAVQRCRIELGFGESFQLQFPHSLSTLLS